MTDQKLNVLLEIARKDINKIDKNILILLAERTKVVQKVTEAKKREGREIFSPDRELSLLREIEKDARKHNLDLQMVREVYRSVIESSKRDQKLALKNLVRIGFLNPRGSFSEAAARLQQVKNKQLSYVPFDEISEIFNGVENNKIEFGVVPYQTSFEIGGDATIDHLLQTDLVTMVGETILPLDIALISPRKINDLKKIKVVYGSSWLITRLRDDLLKIMPYVELKEIYSNNFYIEAIQKMELGSVALAPEAFANINKLHANKIFKSKQTGLMSRYAVIGQCETSPTGSDMTTLGVELPNKKGCLHKFTGLFSASGIDILNINLVYLRRGRSEHVFIIDVSGHQDDKKLKSTLAKVKKMATHIKIFGSYPIHKKNNSRPYCLPDVKADL